MRSLRSRSRPTNLLLLRSRPSNLLLLRSRRSRSLRPTSFSHARPNPPVPQITIKDFAKFDVDGDGKIEKSEFVINKLVLMGLVQQVDIDRVEQEFAVMDADGSGEIDMEDLHAYLKEANAKKAAAKGGKPAAVVQEAPAPAAVVQETPDNKV